MQVDNVATMSPAVQEAWYGTKENTREGEVRHTQRQQKEGGITTSKLVPDARTTMTRRDLTSEFEWDRVLYSWYGRALFSEAKLGTPKQRRAACDSLHENLFLCSTRARNTSSSVRCMAVCCVLMLYAHVGKGRV